MKAIFKRLVFLMILVITGCGSDSGDGDLIGSLTFSGELVKATEGVYYATSTASYTHPSKDSTGVELDFSINAYTESGTPVYTASVKKKQPLGGWTITWPTIRQQQEPIIVDLKVSTGDLSGFERVTIPAIGAFVATPSFVNMSTALSQTVTLSGSVTPYTVIQSTIPDGVKAIINGSTLTISENTFQKLNGVIVVESYFNELLSIDIKY